jgi:predicted nucleic acid-binding protein
MPDHHHTIVSNTGPFITLERLPDGFSLLWRLFDQVFIPPEVLEELAEGMTPEQYLAAHDLEDFVVVEAVDFSDPDLEPLDLGERAAIALALEKGLPLLIEERAGRDIATAKGIKKVSGIAGQLKRAHEAGIISAEEAVQHLQTLLSSSRINRAVFRAVTNSIRE